MNDSGNADDFEHSIPVIGLGELVVLFIAPRVGTGRPANNRNALLFMMKINKKLKSPHNV